MTVFFQGRFDGTVALSAIQGNDGNIGFWQDITGTDADGNLWPPQVWSPNVSYIQVNTGTPQNLVDAGNFVHNELVSMLRHDGTTGNVLHQSLLQTGTQDPIYEQTFNSPPGDFYIRFWIKFPTGYVAQMGGANSWRAYFEMKTDGDFRWINFVYTDASGNPFWHTQLDNNANGGLPFAIFDQNDNTSVPVPENEWFMVECFAHRSAGADGRLLTKINGTTIFDFQEANMGQDGLPWDRLIGPQIYGSNSGVMEQWVDDIYMSDTLDSVSPSPSPSPSPAPATSMDANKTFGTSLSGGAIQSVSASSVVVGGEVDVTTKFAGVVFIHFGRDNTTAVSEGVHFRIEGAAVGAGAGQWFPIEEIQTGIAAAVTASPSATNGATLTVDTNAGFAAGDVCLIEDPTQANSEWARLVSSTATSLTFEEALVNAHTAGSVYNNAEIIAIPVDLRGIGRLRLVADGSLHAASFFYEAFVSTFDSIS